MKRNDLNPKNLSQNEADTIVDFVKKSVRYHCE